MSTPLGTTLSPAQRRVAEFLVEKRTCRRCQYEFCELENLGEFRCKKYHPFAVQFDANGNYLCCHRMRGADGCVPADHISKPDDSVQFDATQDDVLLISALAKIKPAQVTNANWRKDMKSGVWVVSRVDEKTRASAMTRQYDCVTK